VCQSLVLFLLVDKPSSHLLWTVLNTITIIDLFRFYFGFSRVSL
jgi:hypothetical protein